MTASRATLTLVLVAALLPALGAATTRLIEGGATSEWRYLDDGTEPPAAWNSADFDDTHWKRGRAPLGYGEPGIATAVGFGPKADAKFLAAYFRHEFDAPAESAAAEHLVVEMRVDDGVVVYLNGREVVRQNVPAGRATVTTRALARVEGEEERVYSRHVIPGTAVRAGRNVLAAQVHQINAVSSDLFFDLRLARTDEPPAARIPAAARAATLAYRKQHYVPPGMRIPDGYVDGGRRMRIAADGTVTSQREIIVVDRSRDAKLRGHLGYVRWLARANRPASERAVVLAQYVDLQYSPPEGRSAAGEACDLLLKPHAGKEVLIGDITHAGVCRHRALVYKILADEAGLPVALVRGNLGKGGAHAWNELADSGGEKWIVDLMNPAPGYRFLKTTDRAAAQYLTVDDKPFYSPVGAK